MSEIHNGHWSTFENQHPHQKSFDATIPRNSYMDRGNVQMNEILPLTIDIYK